MTLALVGIWSYMPQQLNTSDKRAHVTESPADKKSTPEVNCPGTVDSPDMFDPKQSENPFLLMQVCLLPAAMMSAPEANS